MAKADRTREQIIKAAAGAVRAYGPDRISVAGVMARLKLTHGGFYAHFSSKDELIAAALDSAFNDVMAIFAAITDGRSAQDAMTNVIDFYVSADVRDHPEDACPLTTSASDANRFSPTARARLSDGAEHMVECVERLLRNLGRPAPDTEAMSVMSEMVGAVTLARAVNDRKRSDEFLQATRAVLKSRLGLISTTSVDT